MRGIEADSHGPRACGTGQVRAAAGRSVKLGPLERHAGATGAGRAPFAPAQRLAARTGASAARRGLADCPGEPHPDFDPLIDLAQMVVALEGILVLEHVPEGD